MKPTTEDIAAAYRLAFDEAGRALDEQERTVHDLQARASVLIAAAAITTSFFGSHAVADGQLHGWAWLAVAMVVLAGGCALITLWPRQSWRFTAGPSAIIRTYIEPRPQALVAIHRDLALHRAASHAHNARLLGRLFIVVRLGLVLLVISVGLWLVSVSGLG